MQVYARFWPTNPSGIVRYSSGVTQNGMDIAYPMV